MRSFHTVFSLLLLDDADDGELEGEVQESPDLLSDGAVVAVRGVVEIRQEEEDLRQDFVSGSFVAEIVK